MNPAVKGRVLVVDDDKVVLRAVTEILRRDGYDVISVDDAVEGLAASKEASIDAIMLDIKMPNLTGMDLLKAIKKDRPDVEVVMMTAFATVETAVAAVKAGAYDYLTKPFENIDEVSLTVAKAVERRALRAKTRVLEEALSVKGEFENIIGQSSQMRAIFELVQTVSHSSATVLIEGESGTGKELVARAIHYRSPRRDEPFVAVNCSALTETLLESELFGHVKGAFTGAVAHKKGLFEAADGGTLFLDEIGDIPPATQVRLLRVLQEGEVKRVGSHESVKVDVRVIAATHVDLVRAKAEGRFREDLFYRLNVIPLVLPPLRDRPEDVPLLAVHFLERYAAKSGKRITGVSPEAMELLTLHRWPGNVRELENTIERAVVLTPRETLEPEDLPASLREAPRGGGDVEIVSLAHLPYAEAKKLAVRAFERRYLSALLLKNQDNVSSAARDAGLDRSNFRRLLKQFEVGGRGPALGATFGHAPAADQRRRLKGRRPFRLELNGRPSPSVGAIGYCLSSKELFVPEPTPPHRPRLHRAFRHAARLYGRLGKLDHLGGGGLGLSTVVKVAAWAGLLVVLAVLVSRLRGIEAQLDPVAHGVEKLQRDVEAARGTLAEQSKRSRAELEELGEKARMLRLTVEHTADVEAKAGRDVSEVATDARTLRDELQARLDEIRALETQQAEAVKKLADLANAAEASQTALRNAAQSDVASLQALNDSMKGMEASTAALEKAVAGLPVGAAQAELAEVQANAGKLAQALAMARAKLAVPGGPPSPPAETAAATVVPSKATAVP